MKLTPRRLAAEIERWFSENARALPWRGRYEPWHVLVAEVMAQQTRMEVVVDYFERFIEAYPTPVELAGADEREVLALWSGLGYYSRARNLITAARQIVDEHGGEVPSTMEALLELPGVGRYTAGAVASIAFNERCSLVDGNVARVAARVELIAEPWRSGRLMKAADGWATSLVEVCKSPRQLNQGLMELGSSICKPAGPLCSHCPIAAGCKAASAGLQQKYPLPSERKETVKLRIPLLAWFDAEGRVLAMRAPSESLMGGLLHLPHGAPDLVDALNIAEWSSLELLGSFSHAITNRRVSFEIHRAELDGTAIADSGRAEMIAPCELIDREIPSYVRKALGIITKADAGESRSRDR